MYCCCYEYNITIIIIIIMTSYINIITELLIVIFQMDFHMEGDSQSQYQVVNSFVKTPLRV